ncbi:SHOCT domain-containing protein [Chachezhania sediminis]|uniref:SHOCT domain-containing protein n=1 Tax=Chachezhania sediminis TaxID=2599291 RepID=UPI00131E966A|nr:SHOCT domain-containing protein [Chachezhania sediminis]
MSRIVLSAAVLACLSLSGCISFGGSDDTTVQDVAVGQQLTDLDAAYKQGLLTQREYDRKRKQILKQ